MNILLSQKEQLRRNSIEKDRVSTENIHSVATLQKKKYRKIFKRANSLADKYAIRAQPLRAPRVATSDIAPSTPRDCFNNVTLKNRGFRACKLGASFQTQLTATIDHPSHFKLPRPRIKIKSRDNILRAARYLGLNDLDEYKIQFCRRVLKFWEAEQNDKRKREKFSSDVAWKVSLREVFDSLQLSVDNFTMDNFELFNILPGLIFGRTNVAVWHTRDGLKSIPQSHPRRSYLTYPLKEYIIFNADPDWCLYTIK